MIEVFSKPNCTYCARAKALLTSKGVMFIEHIIGGNITRDKFIELFPNAKTVPVIVEDGVVIGGYDQLVEHLNTQSPETTQLLQG